MLLYHFTAGENLRAIATEGLTIGDVPTDLDRMKGRIGVWLTTSESPDGHGLSESAVNKKRFRLRVDVPDTPLLVRWSEWSLKNVTPLTRERLQSLAADGTRTRNGGFVLGGFAPKKSFLSSICVPAKWSRSGGVAGLKAKVATGSLSDAVMLGTDVCSKR